jgi:inosine-uridine nucleoside N-ribohydrolase
VTSVRRIHIDTDAGLDDLLALALAFASPELAVEGITTVAGNVSLEAVTDNARRFLALAGEKVPLGRGAAGPLSLSATDAESFHGADGRGGIALPALEPRELPAAAQVMRQSLEECAVEAVVAIGPLTNVAQLVREDPALFDSAEIVWMGGTLSQGNVTRVAEFNCYADPEAASIVLGSGLSVRLIGLDVTRHVVARAPTLAREPLPPSPMGRFLNEVLATLMRAELPILGEACAVLHDPCAIAAAAQEDLFRYRRRAIEVVVAEGPERGRLRARPGQDGPEVWYAEEVRSDELIELFLGRLVDWSR